MLEQQVLHDEEEVTAKHDACQPVGQGPFLKHYRNNHQTYHCNQHKDGDGDAAGVHGNSGGPCIIPLGKGIDQPRKWQAHKDLKT